MSSWCCNNCPPCPTPPIYLSGNYPSVSQPYFAVHGSIDGTAAKWYAPVFLQKPSCPPLSSATRKTITCGKQTVSVYKMANDSGKDTQPIGYPVLALQPCSLHKTHSSGKQLEHDKLLDIAVNVQNGTYCKCPMTAEENLQYEKAMCLLHVDYSGGCC